MTRIKRAVALLCILALHACSEDGASPDVTSDDAFVLRSAGGQSLPVPMLVGDYTNIDIIADTLRFGDNGTGTEVFVTRMHYADDPVGEIARIEREFQYSVRNGRIEIEFPCPPLAQNTTASCIAPPHYRGTVDDGAITFEFALGYPAPLVFQRLK